ncbi:hypothetical protein AAVH_24796 [Aphelenchoides avenae]|nr:hypothetical protein AAVH_24796 [Aphelenchus avenae]
MSHSESNALKTQTQLLGSISLVVLLYGVLHMVPNVVFTVFGYLGIKTNTIVAGIYGIGTGVYSGATLFVYLLKHRTIRECFLLMIGKKPTNKMQFTTVSAIRGSHEHVSH